jgi:formate hydrogenlyase subunit 3/multisubunit Na+/H+ antiporter MnhD subunit
MYNIALLSIGVILTITLILILIAWKGRKNLEREKNYRAFFILGITFFPVGIVLSITTKNPGLIGISGLGAAYLYLGISHRDEWE